MIAYTQVLTNRAKSTMISFFYSDLDSDGKLIDANTTRILAVLRLDEAINQKFDNRGGVLLAGLRVLSPADLGWWDGRDKKEQRDCATVTLEDGSELRFRKVDGAWKLDITPAKPQTPLELANIMERDSKILDQITADLLAGKYKNLSEVRDVVVSEKLSSQPDANYLAHPDDDSPAK